MFSFFFLFYHLELIELFRLFLSIIIKARGIGLPDIIDQGYYQTRMLLSSNKKFREPLRESLTLLYSNLFHYFWLLF